MTLALLCACDDSRSALEHTAEAAGVDPLPSWRDGTSKRAILSFVDRITRTGGPDFVPVEDRIAVFDNDGTLWVEQPMYTQLAFVLDRVKDLAPDHPEWRTHPPFDAVLRGDLAGVAAAGEHGVAELLAATHTNMTQDAFATVVSRWIASAQHPTLHRRYTELVYQPMLEVMRHLRANGFATFIVSGGGAEFIRVFADGVYGVPTQNVIGSRAKAEYRVADGVPQIYRLPAVDFIDDKAGKPVGIQQAIGRRPIAAFGNSDGDFEMLEWVTSGRKGTFGLLVHHTDEKREFAYDRTSRTGKLARGLDEAPGRGWTVVDMKQDWRTIFPPLAHR